MQQDNEDLKELQQLMDKLSISDQEDMSQILNSLAKLIDNTVRYFFTKEVQSQKLDPIFSSIDNLKYRIKQSFGSSKGPQQTCSDLEQIVQINFRAIYEIACKIKKGYKQLTNQQYLKIDNLFKVFCQIKPQDSQFIDLQKLIIRLQLYRCLGSIYILEVQTSGKIFYVGSVRQSNDHIIALAKPFEDIEIRMIKAHPIKLNVSNGLFVCQEEGIMIAGKPKYCVGNKFVKIMAKQINSIKSEEYTTIPRRGLYNVCLISVILLQLQDNGIQKPSISLTLQPNHLQLIDYSKKNNGLVFVENHSKNVILYGLYGQTTPTESSVAFLQQDTLDKQPLKNEKQEESRQDRLLGSEGNVLDQKMIAVKNPMLYPYNSICKLRIGNHSGTAFFLRDKYSTGSRFLMTCAHMFVEENQRYLSRLQEYVILYPAYQQEAEGQTLGCKLEVVQKKIKNVYVHDLYQHYSKNNYSKLSNKDRKRGFEEIHFYDLAIIQLYQSFHPDAKPFNPKNQPFGFDLNQQIKFRGQQNIEIAGYPNKNSNQMWRQCKNHHIKTDRQKDRDFYRSLVTNKKFNGIDCQLILHKLTTDSGSSGGPCYTIDQNQNTFSLIGVHTTDIYHQNSGQCQNNLATNIYYKDLWDWLLNIQGFDQVKGVQIAALPPLKK